MLQGRHLQTAILLEGSGEIPARLRGPGLWPGEAKNRSRDPYPLCVACVQADWWSCELWWAHTDREAWRAALMGSRRVGHHWAAALNTALCVRGALVQPSDWLLGKMGKTSQQQATFHRLLSVSAAPAFPSLASKRTCDLLGRWLIWGSQQLTSLIRISFRFAPRRVLRVMGWAFKSKTLKSDPQVDTSWIE